MAPQLVETPDVAGGLFWPEQLICLRIGVPDVTLGLRELKQWDLVFDDHESAQPTEKCALARLYSGRECCTGAEQTGHIAAQECQNPNIVAGY
jgi:hypothetical protein